MLLVVPWTSGALHTGRAMAGGREPSCREGDRSIGRRGLGGEAHPRGLATLNYPDGLWSTGLPGLLSAGP